MLLREYKKLADSSSDKEPTIFALRDIVSTYYNLRRKELGYPFNKAAISYSCLDIDESWSFLVKGLKKPALLGFVISAIAIALATLYVVVDREWWSLFLAFIIISLFFAFEIWLGDAPTFRRKGSLYKKAYEKTNKKTKISKSKGISSQTLRKFVRRK